VRPGFPSAFDTDLKPPSGRDIKVFFRAVTRLDRDVGPRESARWTMSPSSRVFASPVELGGNGRALESALSVAREDRWQAKSWNPRRRRRLAPCAPMRSATVHG